MKEIIILDQMPVIFTKDVKFLERVRHYKYRQGEVIILPPDAVLVNLPITITKMREA